MYYVVTTNLMLNVVGDAVHEHATMHSVLQNLRAHYVATTAGSQGAAAEAV